MENSILDAMKKADKPMKTFVNLCAFVSSWQKIRGQYCFQISYHVLKTD